MRWRVHCTTATKKGVSVSESVQLPFPADRIDIPWTAARVSNQHARWLRMYVRQKPRPQHHRHVLVSRSSCPPRARLPASSWEGGVESGDETRYVRRRITLASFPGLQSPNALGDWRPGNEARITSTLKFSLVPRPLFRKGSGHETTRYRSLSLRNGQKSIVITSSWYHAIVLVLGAPL